MQTEWIIAILGAVCVVLFLLSKKNPPVKMKTVYNRTDDAAREFRVELETVAELAVRKIEEKISRLDYLIEEAQEKSNQLDEKIKLVNVVLDQIKECRDEVLLLSQKQDNKNRLNNQAGLLTPRSLPAQSNAVPIAGGGDSGAAGSELLNNEKHRVALTMLQEGYNVLDIAKVTGLGKGEIILLQGLRDRKA